VSGIFTVADDKKTFMTPLI